jgi:branched-chain amino acid transport system permease protein
VLSLSLARMSGLTAGLATFIVLLIIYNVASNLNGVTNGTSGVTDIAGVGSPWILLLWTFGAIWLAAGYQLTDACQRLRASREDEFAAQSVGIRIAQSRAAAFALSAFVTGVGGAVYAQVQGTVSPDTYYLQLAVVVIAMLVIGGVRSLTGAVVGTVCISAINQLSTQVENGVSIGPVSIKGPTGLEQIVLGLAMLAILLLRPAGLTGGREVRLPVALAGFRPSRDRAKQPLRGEVL